MRLGPALARWTNRQDGDLRLLSEAGTEVEANAEARRRAIVDLPWAWVQQVHGAELVVVDGAFERPAKRADALVTATRGVVLSVRAADCGALALAAPEGVIGAVHVGWRGLLAGVVEQAVAAMRRLGAVRIDGVLGPCIHAECYEFGSVELSPLVEAFGHSVVGRTAAGMAALDLPRAIEVAVDRAGASLVESSPVCTACSVDHWSHRAAGDEQRQALAVWMPG